MLEEISRGSLKKTEAIQVVKEAISSRQLQVTVSPIAIWLEGDLPGSILDAKLELIKSVEVGKYLGYMKLYSATFEIQYY